MVFFINTFRKLKVGLAEFSLFRTIEQFADESIRSYYVELYQEKFDKIKKSIDDGELVEYRRNLEAVKDDKVSLKRQVILSWMYYYF